MNKLTGISTMNFSKRKLVITGLAAAIALAGCSSDDPDAGSSVSSTPISGTAVDGYVAGATIYVDRNNNGRKNAGEPSAVTDKDGYFSMGKDGTNYCASDATSLEKIHCLEATGISPNSNLVIRTFGGFDLYTGEPFIGSLARRVSVDGDGVIANQMVSPLTSMMVDIEDADEQQDLLDFFGLASSDLDTDFLSESEFGATTVNAAIKLHKVVSIFSEAFTDRYEEFGEERSFPESPNAIIYEALATRLAASSVLNTTTLTNAFNDAQTAIRALYEDDEDLSPPSPLSTSPHVQNALDMIGLVDNALPVSTSFANAKTRVIGVETVLKKMVDGDSDVSAAITEASNTGSGLYTAIDAALSVEGGDVDFTALTEVNYNAPNYGDVAIVGGGSFADLANKQLFINLNDDGQIGDGYIFFNSEQGANAGELNVCLRYDDGEPELNFEESDGVLLSGTWQALDDSRLILKLAGALTLSLSDKGVRDEEHRYTLSYGGETRSWVSDSGILDELESQNIVEQPTSDESCEALLESNDQQSELF